MNASGGSTLLALDTSRVRVDPRLLSPLSASKDDATFKVIVAGAASHDEAEQLEDVIEKLTNEDGHSAFDTDTKTWGVIVGSSHPREEAEELRARLEAAGFDASIQGPPTNTDSSQAKQPATQQPNAVKLTSSRPSLPSREVVASGTAGAMFSSSAPVVFAY
jgi:hypothetical protein